MDLLVIDRDAVGDDLIWHFMTARLATSSLSGVLSPLSTGTKPPGSHLRDQGEESNAVRKNLISILNSWNLGDLSTLLPKRVHYVFWKRA